MMTLDQINALIADLREIRATAASFEKARTTAGAAATNTTYLAALRKADICAGHMIRMEYELHCKLVEAGLCAPYERDYYGGSFMEPLGAFGDMCSRGLRRVPNHPALATSDAGKTG